MNARTRVPTVNQKNGGKHRLCVCETQIAELCVYDTGGTMFTFHKIQTVLRTN